MDAGAGNNRILKGKGQSCHVWSDGVQADLNNLLTTPLTYNGAPVTLTNALSNNDFGQIVATGTYTYTDPITNTRQTGTRSFVLDPVFA